ncbi:MAG: AtpZ/AtpI family protein [Chloroflexi bacterium]|nr:AtpZ/AtpI family protein [Chloroflexota bacterium]
MGEDRSTWRALALASQIGCSIAIPLILFIAGGIWLDALLGVQPLFLVVGILVGLTSGFLAIYELLTFERGRESRSRDGGARK